MIAPNEFIESSDTWHQSPIAVSGDDTLCSFVALRLLAKETLEIIAACEKSGTGDFRSILSAAADRVDAWQDRWNVVDGMLNL